MKNKDAYNQWSPTYDTVGNATRDKEAFALRNVLSSPEYPTIIELGCGTGKNTEWLSQKARHLIAVDFSEEMVNIAKKKITSPHVEFVFADISRPWNFTREKADLITGSLILEHIENIEFVFQQVYQHLNDHGLFYIGELHPFKQYLGSKARFETDSGLLTLDCFIHNISDYMDAAARNNFTCVSLTEWFDEEDRKSVPRVICFLFQKN